MRIREPESSLPIRVDLFFFFILYLIWDFLLAPIGLCLVGNMAEFQDDEYFNNIQSYFVGATSDPAGNALTLPDVGLSSKTERRFVAKVKEKEKREKEMSDKRQREKEMVCTLLFRVSHVGAWESLAFLGWVSGVRKVRYFWRLSLGFCGFSDSVSYFWLISMVDSGVGVVSSFRSFLTVRNLFLG